MKRPDLTGQTFGRLTVLRMNPNDYVSPGGQRRARWDCRCACGNHKTIVGAALKAHSATSCGCYANELRIAQGHANAETYTRRHNADKAVLAIAGWHRGTANKVRTVLLGDSVVEVRHLDER